MLEIFLRDYTRSPSGINKVFEGNNPRDASVDSILPRSGYWTSFRIVILKVNRDGTSLLENLYADLLSVSKKNFVEVRTSLCWDIFYEKSITIT